MKCHYVFDKDVGKVLIPSCWSVVMSNDIKGSSDKCVVFLMHC